MSLSRPRSAGDGPRSLVWPVMRLETRIDPPRTPDGKPDFRGHWSRSVARGTDDIEEHAEGLGDSGGYSQVVDPADGKIPYQPWAAAAKRDHFTTYYDPPVFCSQPGVPRQVYTAGVNQILQTPNSLIFLNDYAHSYRIIHLDDRPHVGPTIRLVMGHSRGRWEGNTLIVDVTNQSGKTWFDHNMGKRVSRGEFQPAAPRDRPQALPRHHTAEVISLEPLRDQVVSRTRQSWEQWRRSV